jgi:CelD/BcsL family acetyltransferase involved in cellulose biosynthesis
MRPLSYEVIEDEAGLRALRPAWQRLWAATRPVPPMLEYRWIAAWWRLHGDEGRPDTVVLRDARGEALGIAPLYRRWHETAPSRFLRTVRFLGTGEAEPDETTAEYLGWLAPPEVVPLVTAAVACHLGAGRQRWDRLLLADVSAEHGIHLELPRQLEPMLIARQIDERPSFLMPVLPSNEYVARLPSTNFRHRCRRALRAGDDERVTLVEAVTEGDAMAMLAALADLHQRRWHARGRPGVFASRVFTAFHAALVPAYVRDGTAWLAGVRQGDRWLALRYHLRAGDRLFDYLSGVALDGPPALAPGLLLSLRALDWARAHGVAIYDLMAGDYEYKRRLALETGRLVNVDLFARTAAAQMWLRLREMRRRMRRALHPAASTPAPACA